MTELPLPEVGDSFGRYRIDVLVSRDGERATYAAHDTALERPVTLVISSQDGEPRARLAHEAAALGAVDSPHILRLHEHGEHNGWLYVVEQPPPTTPGEPGDLEALIRERGLPTPEVALHILAQIAAALAAAHTAGLSHGGLRADQVRLRRGVGRWHVYLSGFLNTQPAADATPEHDQRALLTLLTSLIPTWSEDPRLTRTHERLDRGCIEPSALAAELAELAHEPQQTPAITGPAKRGALLPALLALAVVASLVTAGVWLWPAPTPGGGDDPQSAPVDTTRPTPTPSPSPEPTPTPSTSPDLQPIALRDITVGTSHRCLLRPNGDAECLGENSDGQLTGSRESTEGPITTPVKGPWTTLQAGDLVTCGVRRDTTAVCWGRNRLRRFGTAVADDQIGIWHLPGRGWAHVASGYAETCATKVDGSARCWGEVATESPAGLPSRAGYDVAGGNWAQIVTGEDRCGLTKDGRLRCWGRSLGREHADDFDYAGGRAYAGRWRSVSVNAGTACGVRRDHSLACWGQNNLWGVLGVSEDEVPEAIEPRAIPGDDWQQVEVGESSVCALTRKGEAWCWADNTFGTLGNGTTEDSLAPQQVEGGPFSSIAIGGDSVCAMGRGAAGSETAWCWGEGWGSMPQRIGSASKQTGDTT